METTQMLKGKKGLYSLKIEPFRWCWLYVNPFAPVFSIIFPSKKTLYDVVCVIYYHIMDQVAIMGRPNVGKSSLLNAFVGSERVLAGPAAGLTRDSIHVHWNHAGRTFRLVDTAGWVSFSLFPSGWEIRMYSGISWSNFEPYFKKMEKVDNESLSIRVLFPFNLFMTCRTY